MLVKKNIPNHPQEAAMRSDHDMCSVPLQNHNPIAAKEAPVIYTVAENVMKYHFSLKKKAHNAPPTNYSPR